MTVHDELRALLQAVPLEPSEREAAERGIAGLDAALAADALGHFQAAAALLPKALDALERLGRADSGYDVRVSGRTGGLSSEAGTVPKGITVRGSVEGRVVRIEGNVMGRVLASERIELMPTCMVAADLEAPDVQIRLGAKFKGSINIESISDQASAESSVSDDASRTANNEVESRRAVND